MIHFESKGFLTSMQNHFSLSIENNFQISFCITAAFGDLLGRLLGFWNGCYKLMPALTQLMKKKGLLSSNVSALLTCVSLFDHKFPPSSSWCDVLNKAFKFCLCCKYQSCSDSFLNLSYMVFWESSPCDSYSWVVFSSSQVIVLSALTSCNLEHPKNVFTLKTEQTMFH